MLFDAKTWFRASILPYLTLIKTLIATLTGRIESLESDVGTLKSITGAYKGAFGTYAQFPTGSGVRNGDWAILTVDDPGASSDPLNMPLYESGIYVREAGIWNFVLDLTAFGEIRQEIFANQEDYDNGYSQVKTFTVAQTVAKINQAIASIDLSSKADLGGNATQKFLVAAADADSNQALRASQFSGSISASEAQSDWNIA